MRFSIVIPTRNRAACLSSAIASCLGQRYESFEVIVSDNCSPPDTAAVVNQFDDSRLRYVRPDRGLSMVDHWEFAIGHARGEFVLLLGDDDALLQHALVEIDRLLHLTGSEVVRWDWAYYGWPQGVVFEGGCDFYCNLPEMTCVETTGNSAIEYLKACFPPSYSHLPMLYNSAISLNIINGVKEKCGRFLTSVNPDIASGVAVASCCDSYWTSRLPMSIAGLSSHSNGLQHLHGDGKGDSAKDFWKLMEVSAVRWQQSVPRVIGSLAMGISDSLVGASRAGLLNKAVGLDSRGMILACIREMSGKKPDCFADTVETVRGVLQRDRPEEIAWFEGVVREFAPRKSSAMSSHGSRESELHLNLGIDRGVMRQRLVDLRVSNCAEAAEWFEQTFRCAECPREWNIVPLGAHPTTDRRSALMRGLNRLRRAGRVLLTGR